jgi:hypothetical protein
VILDTPASCARSAMVRPPDAFLRAPFLLNYLILRWPGPSDAATLPDCSDGTNRRLQCVDIRRSDATSLRFAAGNTPDASAGRAHPQSSPPGRQRP